MANLTGSKWGSHIEGTPGGVITWSFAGAGEDITAFGTGGDMKSTTGDTFLTHDYEQTITDAFASWSSHGNIEFIQVEDQGGPSGQQTVADIRIFFGSIPGGTIGYAYYPSSYGSAIAGDILIDTVSLLETNTSIFRGVMLHEIGHALGLDHDTGETIMTTTIRETTLQQDDIDGIQQIYGVQDGADPVHDLRSSQDDLNILDGLANLTVNGNARDNTIDGSDDGENINGAGGNDRLNGRDGDDALDGGIGDDYLNGGAGADTIVGGAGADTIDGGDGHDIVDYSDGKSAIKLDLGLKPTGELGEALGDVLENVETIIGTDFSDLLLGVSGKDWFYGGAGDDDLRGRASRDRLFGGEGEDLLNGGKGRDRLEGGSESDKLWGMSGADILLGGQGRDTMYGGEGRDILRGGLGDDHIYGDGGNDMLTGNTQNDMFYFSDGHGNDVITDFEALNALEKIDLSGISAINNMFDLTGGSGAATQSGADVVIDTGGGNSILLENVSLANLDSTDFMF